MKIIKVTIKYLIIFILFFFIYQGVKSDFFINAYNDIVVKNTDSNEIFSEDYVHSPLIELPPPVPVYTNLLGVGDNLIHSLIYIQAGRRAVGDEGYNFDFAYENIADYIRNADIASVNQETMMAGSFPPSNYPKFNTPTQLGDLMVEIGFDVVNLANNHMLDQGEKGLKETIEFLRGKEELVVVGAYFNEKDYLEIPIITHNDIDFAFVGTTQTTNGLSLPSSSDLYISVTQNESQIDELVEQVKCADTISDIVVVNIHWGTEYTHTPTDFQKQLTLQLVEAGADVILGHHPHVIQPVEYITKANGDKAVVCYSLGNFISVQDSGTRMIGGMLDIEFKRVDRDVSIEDVKFLPCITHYDSGMQNVRIYPYDTYTSELASKHGVKSYTPSFSHEYIYNTVTNIIDAEFIPDNFYELFPYGDVEY